MISTMYDNKKTRQQLRTEARETAKLLVRTGKPRGTFRWDYTLGFIGVAIGILLVVAAPRTRLELVIWLTIMFGSLIYPTLHVVKMVLQSKLKRAQVPITMILLAALGSTIGYHVWPPIRRHTLSDKERSQFEEPLRYQTEPREDIQIICAQNDERACVYAAQFVGLFREAGWRVQNNRAEPVHMNNPESGIVLFKRGVGKLDPNNWRSGLWTALTASVVDVRRSFVNIGIEAEMEGNPELPEGMISVYFALEKEDEGVPTNLTKTMEELGTQWRGGPIPPPK